VSTQSGAVCVRGFVFLGVCCLFEIGAGLSRVSMLPLVIVCSCRRGAPTVFKCVWRVSDATLDRPGTAMRTRHRLGAQACTVLTRSGAVCVRGFVLFGVFCLIEIGAGLSRVSMPPWVNACSSIRDASTVFKSVLHMLDATLDQPGTAMQTRPRPGIRSSTDVVSEWSGVCAWFYFSWCVLPVSDWCRAVQCQHATLGERL
jgi:hypothetical protein